MGKSSKIEWCDHTFNPWLGCARVSPGCDNCYAEAMLAKRLRRVQWGGRAHRMKTGPDYWKQPIRWAEQAKRRQKVFCASLSDWLDNKAPQQWRIELAQLIEQTPELDWLLLTKRIENYPRLSPWIFRPPRNVWLGISAENQRNYDRRWPLLATIPAAVRFVSYEPAIGPLHCWGMAVDDALRFPDWIIFGGESGHRARPMKEDWARSIRDQCCRSGIAFFMKQMRKKAPIPDDLFVRKFPVAPH